MIYTAKIEQTHAYPKRMKYVAKTDSFVEKDCDSLSYCRNFRWPYGWIKESGTPPCEHLDVLVMTDRACELGDEMRIRVIGVFLRSDGDHKLVGVLEDSGIQDLSELSGQEREDLRRLYPGVYPGEGWFGRDLAEKTVTEFFSRRKRKTILTVQHTESQHHLNHMIGAWADWELTENGKRQAYEIGKWLLREDCGNSFHMYVSSLKRALQTAEEMNKTLELTPQVTDAIREVNAGAGNGKSREWCRANEKPKGDAYDPDYKPFDDADSDRDLWDRLRVFHQEIMTNDHERILVVSHGTSLSFLHSMLMGHSLEDLASFRLIGSAGAVSKFTVEPSGKLIASYVNQRVC